MTSDLDVFVYGTLKPGECNFDRYCSSAIACQRAYVNGELYHFPTLGYPGMIHGDRQVHGFILTFSNADILANLDELEAYDPAKSPAENEYTRELVTAYNLAENVGRVAWVYTIAPTRIGEWGGMLVPDGWWIGNVTQHRSSPLI